MTTLRTGRKANKLGVRDGSRIAESFKDCAIQDAEASKDAGALTESSQQFVTVLMTVFRLPILLTVPKGGLIVLS